MVQGRYSGAVAALIVAGLLLAGCAGTARGVKESVYRHDAGLEVVDDSRSPADAMVIVRYPAVVHPDAASAYFRAFEGNAIGGSIDPAKNVAAESDRVAQSLIAKSNYYVMSLYRELARGLPRDAVLLSPHAIELDANQRLTSRPLLASEQVPSVLTIDFNVYSYPNPRKMMDAPPITFGDLVTPLFTIHASRWMRPPTNGLLLSSQALVESAWVQSRDQADAQTLALRDAVEPPARPLDFITFLDRGDMAFSDLPLKSPGPSRQEVVAVELHPLEKIRMAPELMAGLGGNPDEDPFAEEFVKGAASRIVAALNRADHDRATFFARQRALARFDPELAFAFLARSGGERLRARLAMAETLIEAERRFLSAQSAALYDGAWEGVYGDQMRQVIRAEYEMLEERRDLARKQNWSTALAVLAMAGAAYAGSDYDSDFLHSSTFENIALITSLWAVNSAMSSHQQSKVVGQNFLLQMAPAINRQVSVQLEWLDSTEQITASDFGEFRDKTMALYQKSVRSLPGTRDRRCRFSHPAVDASGDWFGDCREQLAHGSGYGLAVDSRGNTVEYLGRAAAGRAEGDGAMILRPAGQVGGTFFEGRFHAGLPHGSVRVEEAGLKPRLRRYVEGVDRGKADVDEWQRVEF